MCVQALSTASLNIPAPGYQAGGQLVLTDGWMDGWMDGRAGKVKKNHVFSTFLKNYIIYDANCFYAPSKLF